MLGVRWGRHANWFLKLLFVYVRDEITFSLSFFKHWTFQFIRMTSELWTQISNSNYFNQISEAEPHLIPNLKISKIIYNVNDVIQIGSIMECLCLRNVTVLLEVDEGFHSPYQSNGIEMIKKWKNDFQSNQTRIGVPYKSLAFRMNNNLSWL